MLLINITLVINLGGKTTYAQNTGNISVELVDLYNKPIKDGIWSIKGEKINEKIDASKINGSVEYNFPSGEYVFSMEKPPKGYYMSKKPYKFILENNKSYKLKPKMTVISNSESGNDTSKIKSTKKEKVKTNDIVNRNFLLLPLIGILFPLAVLIKKREHN